MFIFGLREVLSGDSYVNRACRLKFGVLFKLVNAFGLALFISCTFLMVVRPKDVQLYVTEEGKSPVEDWLRIRRRPQLT